MRKWLIVLVSALICLQFASAQLIQNALTSADSLVLIKQRAEAGDPAAQVKLGDHYKGAFQYAAAKHWYEKAAMKGSVPAIAAFADMFASDAGWGTNQIRGNRTNQFLLHRLAAAQGFESSHYQVGMAYREGKIAPRDVVLAYKHLKLAKNLVGDEYRKQLVLEMTQQQIADAESQVTAFRPVDFQTAASDLIAETAQVVVFSSGGVRQGLINGSFVSPQSEIRVSLGSLPILIRCESIERDGIMISIGTSKRRLAVASQPRRPASL